jgi:Zn-dependent protease
MNFVFRLGSIPVRVHGSFLLLVVCLGGVGSREPRAVLQWVVIVFAGVLLHELGHALVGRSFGLTPQIDLIGFGGLTSWSASSAAAAKMGAGKRIAISLAGPLTGIAIGLATLLIVRSRAGIPLFALFEHATPWSDLTWSIFFVNAGWGALNLLPVLPMDGGSVLFQSLNWLTKGRGEKPARIVSAAVAVAAALLALLLRQWFALFLAGSFAVQNVQALQAVSAREKDAPLREVLKAGFDALERNEPMEAVRIARDALSRATDRGARIDAVRLLAFGYLHARAWPELIALMESPESALIGSDEMAKFEEAARQLEQPGAADRIAAVRDSRTRRPRS